MDQEMEECFHPAAPPSSSTRASRSREANALLQLYAAAAQLKQQGSASASAGSSMGEQQAGRPVHSHPILLSHSSPEGSNASSPGEARLGHPQQQEEQQQQQEEQQQQQQLTHRRGARACSSSSSSSKTHSRQPPQWGSIQTLTLNDLPSMQPPLAAAALYCWNLRRVELHW